MAILPSFRDRFQTFSKLINLTDRRPDPTATDTSAVWKVDDSEIWATSGTFNRLTRVVLAAHRLRLDVSLIALRGEPGFRVIVTDKEIAPQDPDRHHPGLGDLAESCFSMAGKTSPLSLLDQARPLVLDAVARRDPSANPESDPLVLEIDRMLAGRSA